MVRRFILIILIVFIWSCEKNEPFEEILPIELIEKYSIDIEEPSGLDLGINNNSLWTVSDRKSKIYNLDLTGKVLQEISIPATDLEGIAFDSSNNTIWVVLEGQGEVLQIDMLGNELRRAELQTVRDGGGLEGITINSANSHLFLVKEKDPSVILELNTKLETLLYKRISAANDYSGIDYNLEENILWLVSDQNKEILKYDLNGNLLNTYSIDVEKAEGIAVDGNNNLIYIVSDSADSLYVYQLNT